MADRREHFNDPEESERLALEGAQAKMWTALPGIIVDYDPARQTCSVQPAIQGVVTNPDGSSQTTDLPLLVDVPVQFPRGGGFACTFPLLAGDDVLVVFASRCIDAWWQSGGVQRAMEARMHDMSDGFAIPGPTSQPRKLNNVQTDGIELRDEARTTYLKVTAGTIFIKGNIVHEGNTNQTGNNTVVGIITGTQVKEADGTGLGTHTHGTGMVISGQTPVPNNN